MRQETQRLILARLCGNIGDAKQSVEEMEQCPPMVFTACKVVGGVICKAHALSQGGRVLEIDGVAQAVCLLE